MIIYNSPVKTGLIIALSCFGALTLKELCAALKLEKSHVTKRLHELRRRGLVYVYTRSQLSNREATQRQSPGSVKQVWCIDPRHPLHRQIVALGRDLATNFPLPGSTPTRTCDRTFVVAPPTASMLTEIQLNVLGDRPIARAILLLSRIPNMQIYALRHLLGFGRGTLAQSELIVQGGVIRMAWSRGKPPYVVHMLDLNPELHAYRSLKALGCAIDDATGHEYLSLAKAYISEQQARSRKRRTEPNGYSLRSRRVIRL